MQFLGLLFVASAMKFHLQMQQEVVADHPRALSTTYKGTPGLDLPAGLIADLAAEGISYEASCNLHKRRSAVFFTPQG